jgi:sister chromatid cohesion protein PDS5
MVAARGRRRVQEEPEPEPEDRDQEEAPVDEQEQEQEQARGGDELVSLKFNEELTWRPGRPIATGTLLTRLEKLSKELADVDQDNVDVNSLAPVVEALGSRNLIAHKDAGVKAKTACCLVEILRLCAPDAPFTEEQLQVSFYPILTVIRTHADQRSSFLRSSSRSSFPAFKIPSTVTTETTSTCLNP